LDALTDGQVRALRNLDDKRGGELTPFLNIAHAQQLTVLGLAQRTRQGWEITGAGSAYLQGLDNQPGASGRLAAIGHNPRRHPADVPTPTKSPR